MSRSRILLMPRIWGGLDCSLVVEIRTIVPSFQGATGHGGICDFPSSCLFMLIMMLPDRILCLSVKSIISYDLSLILPLRKKLERSLR
jgi:hypothetical protein